MRHAELTIDDCCFSTAVEAKLDDPLPRMHPTTLAIPGIFEASVGLRDMSVEQKEGKYTSLVHPMPSRREHRTTGKAGDSRRALKECCADTDIDYSLIR